MKQIAILVGAVLISTCSFANTQSSLTSGGSRLVELGNSWKTHQTVNPAQLKNDINMVYGGADISRRPTLVEHTATA